MSAEPFIAGLRAGIGARDPGLLPLFDVMAGEARFARQWLDNDLHALPAGAALLEVGGGVFILSCQLAREGFAVTTIEPTGAGFGALGALGDAVLVLAGRDGPVPRVLRARAEDFDAGGRYPFAFSVNVMEHVDSPEAVLARVAAALEPAGSYRFLCPNYLFPYEPHFNMATLGSKGLTGWVMRRRIQANRRMEDPAGVWRSLNWITVPRVRRSAARQGLAVHFETATLAGMLERALDDPLFAARRSPWMTAGVGLLRRTGLLRLARHLPASVQPVMDVRVRPGRRQ